MRLSHSLAMCDNPASMLACHALINNVYAVFVCIDRYSSATDLHQNIACHLCRFGTLALRVRTARFFQAVFAMAVAVLGWAVHQLDYARQFR